MSLGCLLCFERELSELLSCASRRLEMKVLILMGSPRLCGNTAELCKPFIEELKKCGNEVIYETLCEVDYV